jgi:meiotically up-regulated gene 157 (Mug157) protein
MVTRRGFLQSSALSGLSWRLQARGGGLAAADMKHASHRPAPPRRRFTSPAVEAEIVRVKALIGDQKLASMFENCFPNTLDTTVHFKEVNGKPDTFVITGDIDAMWLRDSSAQVVPYLPLAKEDAALRRMVEGLIRRQSACILIDPYANAFMPDPHSKPLPWAVHDITTMKPGVGERKWEIDSLCYPIRLAHGYWKHTGDSAPFDEQWRDAARTIVTTFREQQRKNNPGPYRFQRASPTPTETQFLKGYGNPTRPNGMIHSMFRPSDDACLYPLFVPANLFAVASLRNLAELASEARHDHGFAEECRSLAAEVSEALQKYGRQHANTPEETWAYEVDGYGNQLFMDDANAPSLLSLPYLGCCEVSDPIYQRTRARAWSTQNPYFFQGTAAEGIGGPHEGLGMIWPMSILMRALTSTEDQEIRQCLQWIKMTDAGTGFIHESFEKNDPKEFTRPWFAWANTLFGELIVRLSKEKPTLLSA